MPILLEFFYNLLFYVLLVTIEVFHRISIQLKNNSNSAKLIATALLQNSIIIIKKIKTGNFIS